MTYSYYQFNMANPTWQNSNRQEFINGNQDKIMISLLQPDAGISIVDMFVSVDDWQSFVSMINQIDRDFNYYTRVNRTHFGLFSDDGNAAVKEYIDSNTNLRPNSHDVKIIFDALSKDYPEIQDTVCREAIYDYLEARKAGKHDS